MENNFRAEDQLEVIQISLDKIRPNPDNPRGSHSEPYINGLAESIKMVGLRHYPSVIQHEDGTATIVDGHGRVEACRKLGKDKISVQVANDNSEFTSLFLNFYQTKWNPLAEAQYISDILQSTKMPKQRLAACLGIQPPQISQRVKIAEMAQRPGLKEKLYAGKKEWQFTELRDLSKIKDETEQLKRIEQMLNGTSSPHSDATENHERKNKAISGVNKKPADSGVSVDRTQEWVSKTLNKLLERLDTLSGKLKFTDVENLRKKAEDLSKLIEAAKIKSPSTEN